MTCFICSTVHDVFYMAKCIPGITVATSVALPEDRYPKQLFNQEWNIKPRRGRQRKVWSRMVDDLFKSLDIDKSE